MIINSLDIAFIHGDIQGRSRKKDIYSELIMEILHKGLT